MQVFVFICYFISAGVRFLVRVQVFRLLTTKRYAILPQYVRLCQLAFRLVKMFKFLILVISQSDSLYLSMAMA